MKGCDQIILYEGREKHEKYSCDFTRISCTNNGCEEEFSRRDILEHEQLCPFS